MSLSPMEIIGVDRPDRTCGGGTLPLHSPKPGRFHSLPSRNPVEAVFGKITFSGKGTRYNRLMAESLHQLRLVVYPCLSHYLQGFSTIPGGKLSPDFWTQYDSLRVCFFWLLPLVQSTILVIRITVYVSMFPMMEPEPTTAQAAQHQQRQG